MIRWNTALSGILRVHSGIRQGGVLSPNLFNVYADIFINNVLINNNGCHMNRCCVSCIMYADDLMLLSSSVSGLQKLLDISVMTAKELCLQSNERKWNCIAFGPRYQCKVAPMYLCDKPMQWVNSMKHLGITLLSSKKIALDLNQVKRKFFGCVNSIMNHSCGMSDMVKLHLVESYCFPVLSYALECFNIMSTHMQQLSACWNSLNRKIFHYKPWTYVRELIYYLDRINFEHLFFQKKLCFLHSLLSCNMAWRFRTTSSDVPRQGRPLWREGGPLRWAEWWWVSDFSSSGHHPASRRATNAQLTPVHVPEFLSSILYFLHVTFRAPGASRRELRTSRVRFQ